MLLTEQTEQLGYFYGDKKAIEMIADAGFDSIDYSMFCMSDDSHILNTDEYKKYALSLKEAADKRGIPFTQAHAPFSFPLDKGEDEFLKVANKKVLRAMEVASILGAEIIVVHPIHFRPYYRNKDFLKEFNINYYKSLIPYCEEFGIKVACENMWQYNHKRHSITDSVCSQPEEFCEYLDEIGSEFIVGCLDLGHCSLTNIEAQDALRKMGAKRVRALHVHDNDYLDDCHALPGYGEMNWDEITKALADINYAGNFTFEADNFIKDAGKDLEISEYALKIMQKKGRILISQIESYK